MDGFIANMTVFKQSDVPALVRVLCDRQHSKISHEMQVTLGIFLEAAADVIIVSGQLSRRPAWMRKPRCHSAKASPSASQGTNWSRTPRFRHYD